MELPFAVESPDVPLEKHGNSQMHQSTTSDASSLVTASSQGSLLHSETGFNPIPSNLLHQHGSQQYKANNPRIAPQYPRPSSREHENLTVSAAASKMKSSVTSKVTSMFPLFRSGSASISNSFLGNKVPAEQESQQPVGQNVPSAAIPETEAVDFTYVNLTDEDEFDIWLDNDDPNRIVSGGDSNNSSDTKSVDILTVLLAGNIQQKQDVASDDDTESIIALTEQANAASTKATLAKKSGNLQEALDKHTEAAKRFHDAALLLRKQKNASMTNSLLLLSQTQAKSALSLKRVLKLQPNALSPFNNKSKKGDSDLHKDRLRATVRGALDHNHQTEADLSESAFLGKAKSSPTKHQEQKPKEQSTIHNKINGDTRDSSQSKNSKDSQIPNPVDEMMELERELKAMDMALEMGNSIASLDNRSNALRNSISDGSFMVVPPGSNSYMSSSVMWGTPNRHTSSNNNSNNTHFANHPSAGPRARANRVQNMLGAASARQGPQQLIVPQNAPTKLNPQTFHSPPPPQTQNNGLESSWWGHANTASQVLSSSVIALASGDTHAPSNHDPAHTKQVMRLMDSLKTLGDENAALLREVEELEAARGEAKATKEQMRQFKEEYGKRFAALKDALEKFRKGHPSDYGSDGEANPVTSSEFARSASTSDQLQRQEQLIRKLTADLKKEKEESKKKDAALRKYESFYKEVKARSAQKAAQRQKETQQKANVRLGGYRGPR